MNVGTAQTTVTGFTASTLRSSRATTVHIIDRIYSFSESANKQQTRLRRDAAMIALSWES